MKISNILYILIFTINASVCEIENYCSVDTECSLRNENARYIFYDINEPEGFNLRRDVYMRMAVFVRKLSKSSTTKPYNYKLVLPPWTQLYHWSSNTSKNINNINWATFFNIKSLQQFAPVIEMHQFFKESVNKYNNKVIIDEVYILQHFKDMFETGHFEERMEDTECDSPVNLYFYNYDNITAENIKCISFHGYASQIGNLLSKNRARTTFIGHAEVAIHDSYGDKTYWEARRSMMFSHGLHEIANEFRKSELNSDDEQDGTVKIIDWTKDKPKKKPEGGPYLGVHLRRRDFVWGRPTEVPSISDAAKQIQRLLLKLQLSDVYVATDAPYEEFQKLKENLGPKYNLHKYVPSSEIQLEDGEIAIIDQIICSHARYFIGTHESTFSFRIQEEREILGFASVTTFNRLCGNESDDCSKPSIWKIVY